MVKRTKAQLVEDAQPLFAERTRLAHAISESRERMCEVWTKRKTDLIRQINSLQLLADECSRKRQLYASSYSYDTPCQDDFSTLLSRDQLHSGVARLEGQIRDQSRTLKELSDQEKDVEDAIANNNV